MELEDFTYMTLKTIIDDDEAYIDFENRVKSKNFAVKPLILIYNIDEVNEEFGIGGVGFISKQTIAVDIYTSLPINIQSISDRLRHILNGQSYHYVADESLYIDITENITKAVMISGNLDLLTVTNIGEYTINQPISFGKLRGIVYKIDAVNNQIYVFRCEKKFLLGKIEESNDTSNSRHLQNKLSLLVSATVIHVLNYDERVEASPNTYEYNINLVAVGEGEAIEESTPLSVLYYPAKYINQQKIPIIKDRFPIIAKETNYYL